MGCARGYKEAGCYPLARQVLQSWCGAQSGGGQDPQSSCPGNRLRPVVDAEFAGKLKLGCGAEAPTLGSVLLPECGYVRRVCHRYCGRGP